MTITAAFYRFTPFDDPAAMRGPLLAECRAAGIKGSLLLAPEGINGTIAGSRTALDRARSAIEALPGCTGLDWTENPARRVPFRRMQVKLKREIVTLGAGPLDPREAAGAYVKPADWNALVADPDTVVIDTRNEYEVSLGSFEGAIDPGTSSFTEFPAWWAENAHRFEGKRVAMFCTGGIRCEKSTAFLRSKGVADVCHLEGGILKYLEEVSRTETRWTGECFVFDERVSVGHDLMPGDNVVCRACRRPVTPAAMREPAYVEGVSCSVCITERDDAARARYAERRRQVLLAAARNEEHLK